MPRAPINFAASPESLIVGLARTGHDEAFGELVRRRQSWIRNLMRRLCGDVTLEDGLSQQVFVQAWQKMAQLQGADRFGPWLQRLAINIWLQHLRKNDALRDADALEETAAVTHDLSGIAMDLERALATLSHTKRLCVVLSYHEGMAHREIAEATGLPAGTVKSHIRRGTLHLRQILSAYSQMQPEKPR